MVFLSGSLPGRLAECVNLEYSRVSRRISVLISEGDIVWSVMDTKNAQKIDEDRKKTHNPCVYDIKDSQIAIAIIPGGCAEHLLDMIRFDFG